MGRSAPTITINGFDQIRRVLPGNGFTFLDPELGLKNVAGNMRERYDIIMRGIVWFERLGMNQHGFLNKIVEQDFLNMERRIFYRDDKEHAEIVTKEIGLAVSSRRGECL